MNQTTTNRSTYSDSELDKRRDFDRSRPLERDETGNLISSNKFDGTAVFAGADSFVAVAY